MCIYMGLSHTLSLSIYIYIHIFGIVTLHQQNPQLIDQYCIINGITEGVATHMIKTLVYFAIQRVDGHDPINIVVNILSPLSSSGISNDAGTTITLIPCF